MKQKQTIQKISKAKSWLFEKTKLIHPLLGKKKKKKEHKLPALGMKKELSLKTRQVLEGYKELLGTALCEHLYNVDEMHRLN